MLIDRICKICNIQFKGYSRSFYCDTCKIVIYKERKQIYNKRVRDGNTRKLGSIDKCKMCNKDYLVNGALQQYCSDCQRLHYLDHDRVNGLKYYHANKFKINPVRNTKRRKGLLQCKICKLPLDKYGILYCSNTCKAIAKRSTYKKWYDKYIKKPN